MTTLFEEVQGAGDLNSQLSILRPAFRDWRADNAAAEESAFSRLTRILTGIYAFGLDGLKDKPALRKVGKDCQIAFPGDTSDKNWWLPIIKMACGDFHPTETTSRNHPTIKGKKQQVQRFVPGELLAKYAVALRALETSGIAPSDVEEFVRAFVYESGTVRMGRWNGVIAADRAKRKANGTTSGRKMHDAGKLVVAAEALLARPEVPTDVKGKVSTTQADFCLMWGYISHGVFVQGGRVEGDSYDAKAKTLAVALADSVEHDEVASATKGETYGLADAA